MNGEPIDIAVLPKDCRVTAVETSGDYHEFLLEADKGERHFAIGFRINAADWIDIEIVKRKWQDSCAMMKQWLEEVR